MFVPEGKNPGGSLSPRARILCGSLGVLFGASLLLIPPALEKVRGLVLLLAGLLIAAALTGLPGPRVFATRSRS